MVRYRDQTRREMTEEDAWRLLSTLRQLPMATRHDGDGTPIQGVRAGTVIGRDRWGERTDIPIRINELQARGLVALLWLSKLRISEVLVMARRDVDLPAYGRRGEEGIRFWYRPRGLWSRGGGAVPVAGRRTDLFVQVNRATEPWIMMVSALRKGTPEFQCYRCGYTYDKAPPKALTDPVNTPPICPICVKRNFGGSGERSPEVYDMEPGRFFPGGSRPKRSIRVQAQGRKTWSRDSVNPLEGVWSRQYAYKILKALDPTETLQNFRHHD